MAVVPVLGFVHDPDVENTVFVELGGTAQLATVPLVVRNLPLCPDCDGNVPSKLMVLPTMVATVIQALLAALRFLQMGLAPLVSSQSM